MHGKREISSNPRLNELDADTLNDEDNQCKFYSCLWCIWHVTVAIC